MNSIDVTFVQAVEIDPNSTKQITLNPSTTHSFISGIPIFGGRKLGRLDQAVKLHSRRVDFDDRFAGAGLAEQKAKSTLLAMHAKGIEDVLLMGQQGKTSQVEGIFWKGRNRSGA